MHYVMHPFRSRFRQNTAESFLGVLVLFKGVKEGVETQRDMNRIYMDVYVIQVGSVVLLLLWSVISVVS